jgi:hypothetical protein
MVVVVLIEIARATIPTVLAGMVVFKMNEWAANMVLDCSGRVLVCI